MTTSSSEPRATARDTFDHRSAGTPEIAWQRAGLRQLPAVRAGAGRLVVLAAHPDDETLGAGGLLAASAGAGADILVIIATDGEASHPGSRTHTPAELAVIRGREVRAAVLHLAPGASIRHLGLPDGQLAQHAAELDAALAALIGTTPTRLITPWAGDEHPDHHACADAGARLAHRSPHLEHWQCPIWFWHWADPADGGLPAQLYRLDLGDSDLLAKRAALAEHVSQHAPLSDQLGDEPILSGSMLAHFERPFECFVIDPPLDPPATTTAYFDALYTESGDPWGLGERFYEQRKRDVVLAALPRRRFGRAFEPGCATGLLTERLLERADEVIAWDVAAAALRQAAERLGPVAPGRVELRDGRIPHHWPTGSFDLIVLSEIGYYCADLHLLRRHVLDSLAPDGVLLACHWTRTAQEHPHTADEVHDGFDQVLQRIVQHVEADFRLDVWTRDGVSVATAEGIV